ncbi:hypothetical protein BHG07_15680 [Brenneria salicis ATCC 15712 = DSM 30166]|nr:hypothetical protein BHG07_15680 [Brenneria salicis ATCC 15712 = DSM 30166]
MFSLLLMHDVIFIQLGINNKHRPRISRNGIPGGGTVVEGKSGSANFPVWVGNGNLMGFGAEIWHNSFG